MFGDLFKEEEEEEKEEGWTFSSSGQREEGKVCEPPPSRGKLKLGGIRNQGSTCYLNSLLQTLLHTPELREELFRLGPEELGCLEDKDNPDAEVRVIPLELQNLFVRLLLLDEQTVTTTALTNSFGWNNNEQGAQQDVQELNRILFSALETSLMGTSGSSLIQRLYHGTISNIITCSECNNISERQEDFLDLTVCVRGLRSLEEALWSMFVQDEVFEGNNQYCCSQCNRLVSATKSARLQKLPLFLTVSLLRFSFDFEKCERFKETSKYSFPLNINLRPYCQQSELSDSEFSYELFSVIIHKGGCYGGHYHVYIKDIDKLGNWEPQAEDKKKEMTQSVKKKTGCVSDPAAGDMNNPLSALTAVLAQKVDGVLLDQLGQKLLEKTGCSWNKTFRKQFGPIRKFVQNHSDVFVMVSNGSRVALRNLQTPNKQSLEVEPNVRQKVESDQCLREEPASGHWFDLNDSAATAITESDIIKQYEGKESAYMLFYRKRTLLRPPAALGDPTYGVPAHLLQMVHDENTKLQKRREEFELNYNRVKLHLHFASHYHVQNGVLQPISMHRDTNPLPLTFDRRKTIGELRLALYQMHVWNSDMVLTVAKNVPAGLHLNDTLTDDQSLHSAGLCNNSNLFVWNGREVNGVCVQTGPEWEPLLLNILRPDWVESDSISSFNAEGTLRSEDAGLVHMLHGFSGGDTLGGIRNALSTHEALVCQEAKEVEQVGGGASRWNVCTPAAMRRTLRELSLQDGDTLLLLPQSHINTSVFSLSDGVVTVTTPLDCRWLQVHCQGEDEDERGVKIPASGDTLVREVKRQALSELQLPEHCRDVPYCLRPMDSTGKPLAPACEDRTVRDAGIKLMTSLYLCEGHAPTGSQRFLFYRVTPPAARELEIIVEETITVKECMLEMLQKAGLNGTCWHLCRLDWCEDVGEPLMEENVTLVDVGVANGDTLVLVEGQLPPKGFVKLAVSWLVEQNQKCVINPAAVSNSESTKLQLQSVGSVEISEEASLQELKYQITTLSALMELSVPSVDVLRVWLVEKKKLTKIIRGNQQTLRKLKLSTGCEVCVQKLLCEENLGLKDILLRLQVGVATENMGGVENFFPTHEFVWKAGLDPSPKGLYHVVSSHCGIAPENLLLAKHLPEQHTWFTIDYRNQSKQQKKKQKKSNKGVNLQGAPYYIRDGDTITVKNLLIDAEENILREPTEQRVKEEKQKTSGKKCRKPEVALSINVGVFR